MREHGMSEVFERKVAEGLAEFWPRLVNPRSRVWLATTPSQGGQIVGSIAIDGEDLGAGQAHLRWFVLDDGCRGQGVGSALLRKALEFVDQQGLMRTVLSASASTAAATFSTFSFFRVFMLSAPLDVLGFDIRAFGLGVDHDQQHKFVSHQVEADDTRTAALSGSSEMPTHLARPISTRDHVAGFCMQAMNSELANQPRSQD